MNKQKKENKIFITISIDPELVRWLDEQIELDEFENRSHGIRTIVRKFIKDREKKMIKPAVVIRQ